MQESVVISKQIDFQLLFVFGLIHTLTAQSDNRLDRTIIDDKSSLLGSLLSAASRNRTRDTRIFSPLLYQLS